MLDTNVQFWVYGIYIFAMFAWTFLVMKLRLFRGPGFFFVFVPYIAFIINLFTVQSIDSDDEAIFFTGAFLSIGLIVMVAILGWFKNMGDLSRQEISLLLLSLILALFSHIEIGVTIKYVPIMRHYRSVLQTFSIVLFLIVLVNYFLKEESKV